LSIGIGDQAPDFTLPDTDGAEHSLGDTPQGGTGGGAPTVVTFTCNHCPYALAWHNRLLDAARDYSGRARFLFVNPNDADRYPADSLDAMRERVQADGGWPVAYLRDESQEVARSFGAQTTPDVFLVDAEGALRYRGAPDADHSDPSAGAAWLREALDAVLEGRDAEPSETEPVGCSVKWKQ
jgi:peroxiredoxin